MHPSTLRIFKKHAEKSWLWLWYEKAMRCTGWKSRGLRSGQAPTSCETLRKSFSVSGPQAFLPVGGREMPSSLSSPSATSAEPLFNLLLASLI